MISKRTGLIALFSTTAVVSLIGAFGAVVSYAYSEKVLPRTLVAGVDISNLTYPEAEQKIDEQVSALQFLNIQFTLEDKKANANLQELGVTIDEQPALNQIIRPGNAFDWLSWRYWRAMFSRKELALTYIADEGELRKRVEAALDITTVAQDAEIKFVNGDLTITDAQKGVSVSDEAIIQSIKAVLASGQPTQTMLAYTESSPIITNEVAATTISDIRQKLAPVNLQFENQQFVINPAAQYSLLDFQPNNGRINWVVSLDKVKTYIATTVARKVNIAMLQKVTQYDTGEITQEGRDGREIDSGQLSTKIAQTITEQIATTDQPIIISARTIPFTEKTVYPDYVAGLFPGLYIDVNLTKQRLFVMNGSVKQAEYLISSGKPRTPTPVGLFYIKNKLPLAQSRLFPGIWMEKWNALARNPDGSGYEGYGLHRVPCFDANCVYRENLSHLGRPVSHGCVRISNEGADWVYDNAPVGTPVNIHT